VSVAGAVAAWLGASIIVLADGRRGLALGLGIATAGVTVVVWQSIGLLDGSVLFVGGAIATAVRLRSGREGWGIMPAGSTPRLILCIASAFLAWWIAAAVTTGSGAALRFTVLTAIGLSGARILSTDDPPALMTSVAALALGAAAGGALAGGSPDLALYVAAAIVAAGAAWLPVRFARAG
jgi:hypothetical protein